MGLRPARRGHGGPLRTAKSGSEQPLRSDFAATWGQKSIPNEAKMPPKIVPETFFEQFDFPSIFDCFFDGFDRQEGAKREAFWEPKWIQNRSKNEAEI